MKLDDVDANASAQEKTDFAANGLNAGRQALQQQAADRILSSAALNNALRLVERIIQQGHFIYNAI